MQIELTKHANGTGTLRCLRVDSSITWRQPARPLYELTRYAVEAVLDLRDGYWARVAAGADLAADEGGAAAGGQQELSLRLAQRFDIELAGVIAWHASELQLGEQVTESSLEAIRTWRDRLFREWFALLPGEAMVLRWPSEAPAEGTTSR